MPEIVRLENWNVRLLNYIIAASLTPQKNCATFVTGAIEAMTGVDLAGQFGEYETLAEGMRLLREAGYKDHVDFIDKHFEPVPKSFAHPGDIAFTDGDVDNAGGIVQGSVTYVIKADGKLGTVPLQNANVVYRIPYAKDK